MDVMKTDKNTICRIKSALLISPLLAVAAVFCGSCDGDNVIYAEPQLVVEGWIDAGGHPIVLLSKTIQPSMEYQDMSVLNDYAVRNARVVVNDGQRDYVLTGRQDDNYLPDFVYTSEELTGEAGKEYTLTVDYDGHHAVAVTTVPAPVGISFFEIKPKDGADSLYGINAFFEDDKAEGNYYKFFVKIEGKDKFYLSSFLGLINGSVLGDDTEVPVYKGVKIPWDEFESFYYPDEVVNIKFAHIDEVSYNYWNDFEELASFSRNPFFFVDSKIRSNIDGGQGYWAGYGSMEYRIDLAECIRSGNYIIQCE